MNSVQLPTFEYTFYSLKHCLDSLENREKLSGTEKKYAKKLLTKMVDFAIDEYLLVQDYELIRADKDAINSMLKEV